MTTVSLPLGLGAAKAAEEHEKMAEPFPHPHVESVELYDDCVVLTDFREDDPEVVSALEHSANLEAAVHQFLRVGARATRTAGTSLDLALVQGAFEGLNRNFNAEVAAAVQRVIECTDGLLDEDEGALTTTLEELKQNLATLLGDAFDEDSKSSVIGKIDSLLEAAREDQHQMLKRVLDTGADGPLAKVKTELAKAVKDHVEDLRRDLKDIATKLAVDEKEAELIEITTAKGFKFEDLVDQVVGRLAAPHGDAHERVGNETGATGTKQGDEVVTLNAEDTAGETMCFVMEVKDRKLSMRATLEELDGAMENRAADVGIAVFSSQDLAPTRVPFHYVGNRAIVVLDKTSADDSALRLAYLWARWMLRRMVGDDGEALDVDRIKSAIDDARQALSRCSTIKRAHSTISKKVAEASEQLTSMVGEVEETLDQIADLV